MSTKRSDTCLLVLAAAECVCVASDVLAQRISVVQQAIVAEQTAWDLLLADVGSLQSRLHALVVSSAQLSPDQP